MVGAFVANVLFENLANGQDSVSIHEIARFVTNGLGKHSDKSTSRLVRALVKLGHLRRTKRNGHDYEISSLGPNLNALVYACHHEFSIPAMYRLSDMADARFRKLFLLSDYAFQQFIKQGAEEHLFQLVQTSGLDQVRIQLSLVDVVAQLSGMKSDDLC